MKLDRKILYLNAEFFCLRAVELSRFAEDFPLTYPIDQTYDVSID
ncbi:hypothetical protein VAT7223_00138 [Vibrio atlanticus]|uniref:Uncharacterized protein n=1 Tax=Vibrio atlanticus TaxID=693153 RepID=A0A1C3IG79_9VIBR|nr:hypothetical protein VAT7223_00138 [Vibrio atlanticus]